MMADMNLSQHALRNATHYAAAAGAIAAIGGINKEYVMKVFLRSMAESGKAANLKPEEIGARVGRSKSAVYADAQQELELSELPDTLLPEMVVNVFLSEQRPLTAAEVAVFVGRDEERIATLLYSLSHE